MKEYKIGLIIFLFVATLISLFPPFEWGTEYLRTQKERKENSKIIEHLPIKQYNFLFSSNKKYFPIGSYQISEIIYQCDKLRIDTSDILSKDVEEGKKGIDTFFYNFHKYRWSDWDKYSESDKKGNELERLYLDYMYRDFSKYFTYKKSKGLIPKESVFEDSLKIIDRVSDSLKKYKIFSFRKPRYYLLSRQILLSEFIIEYFLAFIISIIFQLIFSWKRQLKA